MLEKEYASRIAGILSSSYYRKWVNYFEKVLRATRSKRHKENNLMLLGIQIKLARAETEIWNLLREGRTKAKQLHEKNDLTPQEKKELNGFEEQIFIHEQLIRISRTICDGIAWRNLKYNRTFLNSSARGYGTGRVDINSKEFKSEFDWAYRITKTFGSLVILNDLTRFLKVGDLTEIAKKGVFIHEIKKYGKDVKNLFTLEKVKAGAKISDQAKRLLELQRIAFTNTANVDGLEVETRTIDIDLKININKVKELIRKSEKELIVSGEIDGCITIEITNFKAIAESKNVDNLDYLKSLLTKKQQKDIVLVHSNWDTFYMDKQGNFLRSVPPYSVFPFSAKDNLNMMSGYYLVKTLLNVTKLKKLLIKKGWEIQEITEKELDKQIQDFEKIKDIMFTVKQPLYANAPEDHGFFLIKKGPFSVALNSIIYSRITMEYLSLESLFLILEEMYKIASAKQSSDSYFPRFKNEHKLWN